MRGGWALGEILTRARRGFAPGLIVTLLLAVAGEAMSQALPGAGTEKPLVSHMRRPAGVGPFPAIVLLHGITGLPPNYLEWADWLSKEGYVALYVDSKSTHGRTPPDPEVMAVDAATALRQLKALPFVDANRVGVIGFSQGGRAVLHGLPSLRDAPPIASGFRAGVAFYPMGCSPHIRSSTAALLVLIPQYSGGADTCLEMRERLQASNNAPAVVHVYPHVYHAFDVWEIRAPMPHPSYPGKTLLANPGATADARDRVRAFLNRYVRDAR
jgi:dienelactone hydrolase